MSTTGYAYAVSSRRAIAFVFSINHLPVMDEARVRSHVFKFNWWL
ncbi:hypothetical protein [Nostoc sp.]